MHYILLLVTTLLTSTAFATNSCEDQHHQIELSHQKIQAIKIPDLTYTVNKENCSKVDPTLKAIEAIVPALKVLQKQYEDYYQGCDRSIDIIYAIEEVKINIILMGTLEDLALSLAEQCDSHNLTLNSKQYS